MVRNWRAPVRGAQAAGHLLPELGHADIRSQLLLSAAIRSAPSRRMSQHRHLPNAPQALCDATRNANTTMELRYWLVVKSKAPPHVIRRKPAKRVAR